MGPILVVCKASASTSMSPQMMSMQSRSLVNTHVTMGSGAMIPVMLVAVKI